MRGTAIAIAAFTLSVAGTASAQSVKYTQQPIDPLAIKVMASYAQCVVERDPRRAATLLAADYHSAAYHRDIRDFARSNDRCLHHGKLRFSALIFAGDMAEAFIRREHVTQEVIASAAATDRAPGTARCIVQQRPNAVAALLATEPTSADEHDAAGRLIGTFAECTPKGQTAMTNVVGLRAELALATYHLIHDQAPRAPGNR